MPLHKASAPAEPSTAPTAPTGVHGQSLRARGAKFAVREDRNCISCAASALAGTSRRISQRGSEPHMIGAVAPVRGFEGRSPGLRIQPSDV